MSTAEPQRLVYSIFHLTDLSPESESAFAHALAIALMRGSKLTLLHAGASGGDDGDDWDRFPAVRGTLERWGLLEPGSKRSEVFDKFAVQVKKVSLGPSSSVSDVLGYLSDSPSELIVTGYDGRRGITGVPRDSTAEDVARRAGAMTLFVPNGCKGFVSAEDGSLSLKRVLVPVADDPAPAVAITAARRVAESLGDMPVEVTLLHVGDAPPPIEAADDDAVHFTHLTRTGDPVDEILAVASEIDADLISMVTNGRNSLGELMRGSHTERVTRGSSCPVLALPESWNEIV